MLTLISHTVLNEREDFWSCPGGPKDQFSVAWMRKKISDKDHSEIQKSKWSKEVWYKITNWWDLRSKDVNSIDGVIDSIIAEGGNAKESKILFMVAAATIAMIWFNRNEATFTDKKRNVNEFMEG
ncbi:hypothetical protein L2E82_30946 [Cichorium intybus]|uniref:Uncharacterized protein n=1 Tax=Cichorium intybus TaxID=13427 RepID=A0ACB9D1Q5_CICIN|nr:hypothetical protein L2E82_30946 [Cichorium intybus]